MEPRKLAVITGFSYLIIFFAAIFANFFVLEALKSHPLETVQHDGMTVRWGIMAFIITVVFDVVVAWTLYKLFQEHILTLPSTLFRMMHASVMGVAIFALPPVLDTTNVETILNQVNTFNTIWLLGLFFFGIHLILLSKILQKPKLIVWFLLLAGIMYMVDTSAHILMPNYQDYATTFLALVAIPSILGEMSFTLWLIIKGGKN